MTSSVHDFRVAKVLSQLGLHPIASTTAAPRVSITSRSNGVAIITINNPPVNSLHPEVQSGIGKCYKEACQDPSVKAVVITGTNSFFMAGADIEYVHNELQLKKGITYRHIYDYIKEGHDIFKDLESGPKPTVAAINGTALGGGCELAIACNARIAVPTAVLGQPELNLGIIPGLGGTQRFPRLIGLQAAITATLSAKNIKATDALKQGLIDGIVKKEELIATASKIALDIASGKQPRRKSLFLNDKIGSYENGKLIIEISRAQAAKKGKNVPHPKVYLDCVEIGLRDGGLKGVEAEIDGIAKLMLTPTSKALIHFFFATRATSKVKGVPSKPAASKPIRTVAVLGGGTMGASICIVYLSKGYKVILKEINEKQLMLGVERIVNDLTRVMISRKLPMNGVEQIMRNLETTTRYDQFKNVDLVIEAVLENLTLKQQIFQELESVCPPHCILATNTSTIDVSQIGAKTQSQNRILGLHFFSPAHVMPLLEIVRTKDTSPDVVATCLAMSKKVGKTPVVVGNCVGFVANRAFFPYGQSACFLVDAGLDPYRIDRALEKFGMPMGVFRMCDLSGIDIFIHVNKMINQAYGERCYNSTLNQKMVAAKRLGQKSSAGFYRYNKTKYVLDAKGITPLIEASRRDAKLNIPNMQQLSDEQIVQIVMYPIVNESLRTVDEGFANSKGDVDVVSVMGFGYPAYRGGILHWAEHQAKDSWAGIYESLQTYSKQFGEYNPQLGKFFEPCKLLKQLAQSQCH